MFFHLSLSAVAWAVYHLTRRPGGRIPPVVAGLPLLGSAVRFGQDPINLMLEARARHGDVFTLKVFHEHMIFFVGAEAQEVFFKTSEDVFNAAAAYKFTVPLFGKDVVYDGPPELLIEEVNQKKKKKKKKKYFFFKKKKKLHRGKSLEEVCLWLGFVSTFL